VRVKRAYADWVTGAADGRKRPDAPPLRGRRPAFAGQNLIWLSRLRSEDEAIVEQIKLLSAAGLTLPAVRQFLPCALDARGAFEPCDELKALVQKHLARLNGKMDALARSRALLEAVMVRLDERA
jgi:hypothetical protein